MCKRSKHLIYLIMIQFTTENFKRYSIKTILYWKNITKLTKIQAISEHPIVNENLEEEEEDDDQLAEVPSGRTFDIREVTVENITGIDERETSNLFTDEQILIAQNRIAKALDGKITH